MLYRTKWLKNRNDDGTPKQPCRYLENFSLYDVKSVQTQHRLLILNNMWQVVLWEKILEKNESDHHIANMIDQLIADLKTDSDKRAKLPQRIFVFGISSLPTKFLELLKALGQYIDVCYMFLNPCCQYWGDISKTLYDSITGIHAETFAEKLMRKVKTFPNFSAPEGSRNLLCREGFHGADRVGTTCTSCLMQVRMTPRYLKIRGMTVNLPPTLCLMQSKVIFSI